MHGAGRSRQLARCLGVLSAVAFVLTSAPAEAGGIGRGPVGQRGSSHGGLSYRGVSRIPAGQPALSGRSVTYRSQAVPSYGVQGGIHHRSHALKSDGLRPHRSDGLRPHRSDGLRPRHYPPSAGLRYSGVGLYPTSGSSFDAGTTIVIDSSDDPDRRQRGVIIVILP